MADAQALLIQVDSRGLDDEAAKVGQEWKANSPEGTQG